MHFFSFKLGYICTAAPQAISQAPPSLMQGTFTQRISTSRRHQPHDSRRVEQASLYGYFLLVSTTAVCQFV